MFVFFVILLMFAMYKLMISVGQRVPGKQRGLENPIYLPFLWVIFQLTDFMYLYYDTKANLRGLGLLPTQWEISKAFVVYSGLIFILLFGINYGLKRATHVKFEKPLVTQINKNSARFVLFYCIAILIITIFVFFQFVSIGGRNFSEVSALKSKTSGEFPIISILIWLAVDSVCLLMATSTKNKFIILAYLVPAVLLSWGTGARIHILILAVFALQAFKRRKISISIAWAPFIAPVLIILFTVLRSVRAGAEGLNDFLYDRGGVLSTLFGSDEVATAETMTFGLKSLSQSFMDRWPGEGIVGLLLSPLPRAAVDWKPLPASSQFSEWLSPGLWASSRSQYAIGGVLESCMEFGIVGAAIYLFAIGFVLGMLLVYASRHQGLRWFYYGSLSIFLLLFLRTDMQGTGIYVWPWLITVIMISAVQLTMPDNGNRRRSARHLGAPAPSPKRGSGYPRAR